MKKDVALGIDIGGTNTAFGFIDREGNYLTEGNIPTAKHEDINDYLKELYLEIEKVLDPIRQEVNFVGIGIGAPNGNYFKGAIEFAPNLPWHDVIPLCDMMKEYYPELPVYLNNDAKAAAIGEMIYGGAQGMKNFIMITLGTGLGSGFVVNGELVYGHDGFAGELGHTIVSPNGRQCGCGRSGCLETYVSATGVKRTAYKMMAKYNYPSELRSIPFNEMNAKIVSEVAQKGDMIAINTFKYTGKMLGEALANAVAITSPEAIFLMGGLAKAGDLLFEPVKDHMEMNLLKIYSNKVKILPSKLTKNVAIYGAAALVWKELEK